MRICKQRGKQQQKTRNQSEEYEKSRRQQRKIDRKCQKTGGYDGKLYDFFRTGTNREEEKIEWTKEYG